MSEFQNEVFELVKRIPKGCVCSYSQVAKALNKPTASRAVGTALSKNTFTEANGYSGNDIVPCHRVVNVKGEMSGFFKDATAKGMSLKEAMLRNEGVKFKSDGKVDMATASVGASDLSKE